METLRKFEGASLDDILAHVYRECGQNATIVEANRIRRGGVGGFFAKEGFEVVVIPDPDHEADAGSASHDGTEEVAGPARGARLDVTEEEDELLGDFLAGRTPVEAAVANQTVATAPVITPVTFPTETARRLASVPAAPAALTALPGAEAPGMAGMDDEIETLPARRLLKAARIAEGHDDARALHPSMTALEPVVALVGRPAPPNAGRPAPESVATAGAPAPFSFTNVLEKVLADEPIAAQERDGAGTLRPVFDDAGSPGDADDHAFDRLLLFGEEDGDTPGPTLTDDDLRALLGVDDLPDAVRAGGLSGSAGSSVLSSLQGGAFDDRATVADPAAGGASALRADTVAHAMFDDVTDPDAADAPESTLDALARRFTTVDPAVPAPEADAPGRTPLDRAIGTALETAVEMAIETSAEASVELAVETPVGAEPTPEAPAPAPAPRARAKSPAKSPTKTRTPRATKPAAAKPAPRTTRPRTGARPAAPAALDLMARYAAVPAAPEAPDQGMVVVVGTPADALAVARRLAGDDTPVALASPDATVDGPTVTVLRDLEAAWQHRAAHAVAGRNRRAAPARQIVVVDAGTGTRGLAWARRVLDVLEPDHVRLTVAPTQAGDDVRATVDLLDGVEALDVVTGDGAPVEVDELLDIGVPVGSVGGWPASPALWAALTLEGLNRG